MVFSHDDTDSEGGSIDICTDYDASIHLCEQTKSLR